MHVLRDKHELRNLLIKSNRWFRDTQHREEFERDVQITLEFLIHSGALSLDYDSLLRTLEDPSLAERALNDSNKRTVINENDSIKLQADVNFRQGTDAILPKSENPTQANVINNIYNNSRGKLKKKKREVFAYVEKNTLAVMTMFGVVFCVIIIFSFGAGFAVATLMEKNSCSSAAPNGKTELPQSPTNQSE